MPGHAQVAQTEAPVLVIGAITYPIGGWMLAAAATLVAFGLCIRFDGRNALNPTDIQAAGYACLATGRPNF